MFISKRCETLAVLLTMPFMFFDSPSAAAGQQCLPCHGQAGMKSEAGENISIDPAKLAASAHGDLGCMDCHATIKQYPHPAKIPNVQCSTCHADKSQSIAKSAHAALGADACQACHANVHELKAGAPPGRAKCAECHSAEVKDFGASIHGQATASGDRGAPNCQSCHGPVHKILPSGDAASLVSRKNLPHTCATCHSDPGFLSRHNIPFARPVEAYRLSVHGRAVERGNDRAPSCSDCHTSHSILPERDPRSTINHWNVVNTCGKCHTDIKNTYIQSVHGQAMLSGARDVPVCTDCHGEHLILAPHEPQSLVNPARVSIVTCGRCHSDERLETRFNLPADKVPTFEDSYHGLASREGSQTVANCASCHGVHNIFPSSDPRSTVNAANLAKTCGQCHAGAGTRFALGPVHVSPASTIEHPVVRWIRLFYISLIPLTLGFMLLHNSLDLLAKIIRGHRPVHAEKTGLVRMNLHFRVAHWLVMVSFPVLVITGFALKFPDAWWVAPIVRWEGHIPWRGTLHRTAAVVLIGSLVYHLVHLILSRRDRAILRFLRPGLTDVTQFWAVLRYNLGLSSERPTFAKFNYAEKIEYWAFIWGTVVMGVSGFLLWFVNFTLRYFPKWVADASTVVHFYEAVLATLSILVWHFYFVIFDPDVYPMDRAWLTGRVPEEHLRQSRPQYYALLAAEQRTQKEPTQEAPPGQPEPAPEPSPEPAEGQEPATPTAPKPEK